MKSVILFPSKPRNSRSALLNMNLNSIRRNAGWIAAALTVVMAVGRLAASIIYNQPLVAQPGLAYSTTFPLNLANAGINTMSAQATFSSATFTNATFVDGQQSTGSFTVLSNTGLSTATATNTLTVTSTSGLTGASILYPGFQWYNGVDWAVGATTAATANSIASALQTAGLTTSVPNGGSVINITAPAYGPLYNSYPLTVVGTSNITVGTPLFQGGQGDLIVTINGVQLKQHRDWQKGASAAASATALAAAINANATLSKLVTAQAIGTVVTATSTLANVNSFALTTSSPTAVSVSGVRMTGGVAPAATLASSTLALPSHGFTTALPLLYTSGGVSLGGLTNQTTYYAVVVDANDLKLASSSSNAQAGTFITLTSSTTQLSDHTATLSALPITGTPGFYWQVSNDGSNWYSLQVASVTFGSGGGYPYANPPTTTIWSFGALPYQQIRLNVTGPTTGGVQLNVTAVGTN